MLLFKVCLGAWPLVRLTMNEAQEAVNRGSRSNPCKYVLDTLMASAREDQESKVLEDVFYGFASNDAEIGTVIDPQTVRVVVNFGTGLSEALPSSHLLKSEEIYLDWITTAFKRSRTWYVGKWVASSIEGSRAKARSPSDNVGQGS